MSITKDLRKVFDACTVMAGVEPDFECVYMTKGAALLYLDEIDAENAQLKERIVTQKQTIQAYRDESREWREEAEHAQAENAKLREQASSLVGRSFRTADKMSCIEADNAKLREEIEAAKHDLQVFSRGSVQLEAENAKLRELARHMRTCMEHYEVDGTISCDRCPLDNCVGNCDYEQRMRELGVDE